MKSCSLENSNEHPTMRLTVHVNARLGITLYNHLLRTNTAWHHNKDDKPFNYLMH